MSLQITGKNINVGESYQEYVEDKLDDAVHKYIGQYLAAHVRVEKERGRFLTNCSIRLGTGLVLESSGEGTDAYSSADSSFERLEKRMRRYKRRLKSHHHGANGERHVVDTAPVDDSAIEAPAEEHEILTNGESEHPVVVAETVRMVQRLPVSEAAMWLDLTDDAFLVFRNASSGEVNVVYRRTDGNIGWIDPASLPASAESKGGIADGQRSVVPLRTAGNGQTVGGQ